MSEQITRNGVLDAARRIAAVMLEKPVAKNSVRSVLYHIDPENAPSLVRELLWHEPELTFSLAAALPQIANCLIRAAEELTCEIGKFPPELIHRFAALMLSDIDRESLTHTLSNLRELSLGLSPVLDEFRAGVEGLTGESYDQDI